MNDEKEGSFKVSDRRKFNPDGTPKDQSTNEIDQPEPAQTAAETEPHAPIDSETPSMGGDNIISFPGDAAKKKEAASGPAHSGSGQSSARNVASAGAAQAYDRASNSRESALPPASFLGVANMLGMQAAVHLGVLESAPGAGGHIDLDAARHFIDLIGVLQEKTRGNLTREEDTLLDEMLADLRMQFVATSRGR